ncbi:hypothetical protein NEDG_00151 [Nematocida displodere]|uniref:Uncharacterized protein n=1 Tax=Nematocida displodere TaxID=1805483 RepID=A0A177EIY0_9MICR|nr:hypothetical protein NEDG_00151 [Nematocida displodere]
MTVLVDTYDIPACAIMSQLYQTMCYEVPLEEVYSKVPGTPKGSKKYVVLKDISPRTLLALRDMESVIYIFHSEMLSEKEYSVIKHYTNELICVDNGALKVLNKKSKKQEEYTIHKTRDSETHRVHYTLHKIDQARKGPETKSSPSALTEKQKDLKEQSLPYLQVQAAEEVHFPNEEPEELSDDSDILDDLEEL